MTISVTTIGQYFLLQPDWTDGFAVRRAWRTGIQEAMSGRERRSGYIARPVRTLAFSVAAFTARECAYMTRRLLAMRSQVTGIPLWPDAVVLTAKAEADQKVLAVSATTDRFFETGGRVIVLSRDYTPYEVGTVATLAANQIVLEEDLVAAWAAGSLVLPLVACRLLQATTLEGLTGHTQKVAVEAVEVFEPELPEVTTSTTTTTTTTGTTTT